VLLLEAGFVTILVAPLNLFGLHDVVWHHCHDSIALLLVRWLLFRLTFASGLAKLTSSSESWWKLTGIPIYVRIFAFLTRYSYVVGIFGIVVVGPTVSLFVCL